MKKPTMSFTTKVKVADVIFMRDFLITNASIKKCHYITFTMEMHQAK